MATKELAPSYHDVEISTPLGKANVHYVEAGDKSLPTFILLMGFPSSSSQFRDFGPLLADQFHVLSPDFPGFGLTTVPTNFRFTFDNLAIIISAWLQHLRIQSYAVYMFDYGAPIGFRLALERPSSVKAMVSQNGNCFDDGFGADFWKPIFDLWNSENSLSARDIVRTSVLTEEVTRYQYFMGVPQSETSRVDPSQPIRDYLLNIAGQKNQEQQLDLLYDYRFNKASYPAWQEFMRRTQIPLLAVWGKHDPAFVPAGAKAFKACLPDAEIHLLEAGHFALETARWEIAKLCKAFLSKVNIGP